MAILVGSVCLAAPVPQQAQRLQVDPSGKTVIGVRSAQDGRVNSLYPISPFGKAGGKVGDFIKKVGSEDVDSIDDLIAALKMYRPGAMVKVEIRRGTQDMTIYVTLGEESHKKEEKVIQPVPGRPRMK